MWCNSSPRGSAPIDKCVGTDCEPLHNLAMDKMTSSVHMGHDEIYDENGNEFDDMDTSDTVADALTDEIFQRIVAVFEAQGTLCTGCSHKAAISFEHKSVQCGEQVPEQVHIGTQCEKTSISVKHKAQQCALNCNLTDNPTVSCLGENDMKQLECRGPTNDSLVKELNDTVEQCQVSSSKWASAAIDVNAVNQTKIITSSSPSTDEGDTGLSSAPGEIPLAKESTCFTAIESSKSKEPGQTTTTATESGQGNQQAGNLFQILTNIADKGQSPLPDCPKEFWEKLEVIWKLTGTDSSVNNNFQQMHQQITTEAGLKFADTDFLHTWFDLRQNHRSQLINIPLLPNQGRRPRTDEPVDIDVNYDFTQATFECYPDDRLQDCLEEIEDDIMDEFRDKDPELYFISQWNSTHYRLPPSIKMHNLKDSFPSGATLKTTVVVYLRDSNRVKIHHWANKVS